MTTEIIESLLTEYETDVHFPDVSGMEHLDMLLTRSRLAEHKEEMDVEQLARLSDADQLLLRQAEQFNHAITAVGDLVEWRASVDASPDHWWWYLDVLTSVPEYLPAGG